MYNGTWNAPRKGVPKEENMGIAVIGATMVDIKGYPLAQYIPAGRNVGRVIQVHGGVSRNIAEDIANVELRPTFVTLVDNSGVSADVVRKLKKHKVNTDYIRVTEEGLGTWLAVFDNSGDVVASISKRPDLTPMVDLLTEKGDEIFAACDSVCVEIDMEPEILKLAVALAQKHGKEIFAPVSNMTVAVERRDLIRETACLVCNEQEAGIFFSENYEGMEPEALAKVLREKIGRAGMRRMVVTLGGRGSIYAEAGGECGVVAAKKVDVIDTTGAGDAFFAGVAIGLTYGKTLAEACEIGTRLAASVIVTKENVCPRFTPEEFGLIVPPEIR